MNRTDVAGEYLREVELRLGGLPLLQRRELLADLEAHIAEARQEAHSEGELIEILERLGSPEVVAAAAYQEAGPQPLRSPVPDRPVRRGWPAWVIALIVVGALLLVFVLFGAFFTARSATNEIHPAPIAPPPAPTATR